MGFFLAWPELALAAALIALPPVIVAVFAAALLIWGVHAALRLVGWD